MKDVNDRERAAAMVNDAGGRRWSEKKMDEDESRNVGMFSF